MWIQVLLLMGAALMLMFFVFKWDKVHTRAWKRIAFFLFLGANIYAVLRPDDLTWFAHKFGVGRGTDLVLYLLVVGVAFMTMNTFLRFRSLERKLTDLARSVAIRDGQLLNAEKHVGGGLGLDARDARLAPDVVEVPETASMPSRGK